MTIMNENLQPTVLTVRDLQSYLSISRSTAYRMFDEGLLQRVRVGRRVLVRKADVDRLVAVGGVGFGPPSPRRSIFD